ncbi:hypothetical protein HJC23_010548 [Cyclotella cryptica]|uniref:Uncharacterized protein n=1 Tax=Cyclotella cryptica TaxID=29204 RepID=A0ABD3QBI4_9STRA
MRRECFHCGIVGIDQIFDRDIDVLNRPFLPVASGEMSGRVAWTIVLLSGIVVPAIVLSPPEFVHAILTGVLSKAGAFRSIPMIGGHAVLATMLLTQFKELEPEKLLSIKKYYKHICDLFYLEYVQYTLI